MKTIHIGRLDLKCRGVEPAVARGALRELGSALALQLSGSDSGERRPLIQAQSAAGLADSVAARVAAKVRARINFPAGGHSS